MRLKIKYKTTLKYQKMNNTLNFRELEKINEAVNLYPMISAQEIKKIKNKQLNKAYYHS